MAANIDPHVGIPAVTPKQRPSSGTKPKRGKNSRPYLPRPQGKQHRRDIACGSLCDFTWGARQLVVRYDRLSISSARQNDYLVVYDEREASTPHCDLKLRFHSECFCPRRLRQSSIKATKFTRSAERIDRPSSQLAWTGAHPHLVCKLRAPALFPKLAAGCHVRKPRLLPDAVVARCVGATVRNYERTVPTPIAASRFGVIRQGPLGNTAISS